MTSFWEWLKRAGTLVAVAGFVLMVAGGAFTFYIDAKIDRRMEPVEEKVVENCGRLNEQGKFLTYQHDFPESHEECGVR